MKNFLSFFLLLFLIEGVFAESVSLTDGDSLTLHTDLTEIKGDEVLEWRFGAGRDRIARVRKDSKPTIYDDVLDGRFRGRLKPYGLIGDLTITNISTEHTGPYEILISGSPIIKFNVIVVPADPVKTVSVMEGDSVTLTGVTEILKYDVIRWAFGHQNSSIAKIKREASNISTYDGPDGSFRDRLKLDYLTGSLTIMNIGTEHSGLYEVDISSSKHTIHKSFSVTVSGEIKSVLSVVEGNPVTLHPGLADIQRDSLHWMFGDTRIAEFYKADNRVLFNDDVRFKDRLKLDHQTGSLTITDIRTTDSGEYKLKIISRRRTVHKRFPVTVTGSGLSAVVGIVAAGVLVFGAGAAAVVTAVIYHRRWISELKRQMLYTLSVIKGESVTIKPDAIEIHEDDCIQWKFEDALLAERRGVNGEFTVHDGVLDERFKGRLKLDKHSGSLTITNIRLRMSGRYELWILRRGHASLNTFRVSVFAQKDQMETVLVKEGGSVTLPSGVTRIEPDDQMQWVFVFRLEDCPIAQIKRGTRKTFPSAACWRFIFRLTLDQTGSLTIKNITSIDTGFYIQYITKSGKTSMKLFRVQINSDHNREDNGNNQEEEPLTGVGVSDSCL